MGPVAGDVVEFPIEVGGHGLLLLLYMVQVARWWLVRFDGLLVHLLVVLAGGINFEHTALHTLLCVRFVLGI